MKSLIGLTLVGALTLLGVGCGGEVELEEFKGQRSDPATSSSAVAQPRGKVRFSSDGQALVSHTGRRARIAPGLVTGYLDNAVVNGGHVDVSGWAAPADLSGPALAAVVMAGNTSVAIARPSRERTDLVEGYGKPGLANAGFAMSIPRASLDCARPRRGLRAFAVAGEVASPLKWLGDVPRVIAEAC